MNTSAGKNINVIDKSNLSSSSADERAAQGNQPREVSSKKKSAADGFVIRGQSSISNISNNKKGNRQQRINKRLEKIYRYGALVEAKPGKFIRLVGSERAWKAILHGTAKKVRCDCCRNQHLVHRSARVLYCRGCKHLTQLVVVGGAVRRVSEPPPNTMTSPNTMVTKIENIQLLVDDNKLKR